MDRLSGITPSELLARAEQINANLNRTNKWERSSALNCHLAALLLLGLAEPGMQSINYIPSNALQHLKLVGESKKWDDSLAKDSHYALLAHPPRHSRDIVGSTQLVERHSMVPFVAGEVLQSSGLGQCIKPISADAAIEENLPFIGAETARVLYFQLAGDLLVQ